MTERMRNNITMPMKLMKATQRTDSKIAFKKQAIKKTISIAPAL